MSKILLPVLGVAAVLTVYPAWFWQPKAEETAIVGLQDEYLGPEFESTDPAALVEFIGQVHGIEVITYDADKAKAETITVARSEANEWRIGSKWDYPADGEKRVGQVVGSVLGVKKIREITRDKTRYEDLELLDPKDAEGGTAGRGKRVILTGKGGTPILDVIVGSKVGDSEATYHVREVGDDAVFTAELKAKDPKNPSSSRWGLDISAKFIDWVKDNPFKVQKDDIRGLTIDKYTLEFSARGEGRIADAAKLALYKPAGAEKWSADGLPPGKQLKDSEVSSILDRLSWLRLADVDKYEGLNAGDLQDKGFFLSQGQLFAKEGSMDFQIKQGFLYRLSFGFATGEATKAAVGETATENSEGKDRLMFVQVGYDSAKDEEIPAEPKAPEHAADAKDEDKAKAEEKFKQDREDWIKKKDKHEADRKKLLKELNAKYQSYFFVIRDYDFTTLRPDPARIQEDVAKPAESAPVPAPEGGAAPTPQASPAPGEASPAPEKAEAAPQDGAASVDAASSDADGQRSGKSPAAPGPVPDAGNPGAATGPKDPAAESPAP